MVNKYKLKGDIEEIVMYFFWGESGWVKEFFKEEAMFDGWERCGRVEVEMLRKFIWEKRLCDGIVMRSRMVLWGNVKKYESF